VSQLELARTVVPGPGRMPPIIRCHQSHSKNPAGSSHGLTPGICLSLVVTFEDSYFSARRSLLSNRQLYLLGTRAKVTRWKEMPCHPHTPCLPTASPDTFVLEPLIGLDLALRMLMAEELYSPTIPSSSAALQTPTTRPPVNPSLPQVLRRNG